MTNLSSRQATEVKKVRHFGIEISQNSVPSARFGNYMENNEEDDDSDGEAQAIDFKSPNESMTIARFGGTDSCPNSQAKE